MAGVEAVLFDLGGTLARYYSREQFPAILRQAVTGVGACLEDRSIAVPPPERLWRRVEAEDHSSPDFRVRPLAGRLTRIFELPEQVATDELTDEMCRRWLEPVFALGQVYDDAVPVLLLLRQSRLKVAIVSNTPWGSPVEPWRREVQRLGLWDLADAVVFCADVGWRKPAPQPFREALGRLQVRPEDSLFVGDDPRWDLVGPRELGMAAVLIDRAGGDGGAVDAPVIRSLSELPAMVL